MNGLYTLQSFKMAYGLGPQGRTPLRVQQYFPIKNVKHGFNGTFLLYMRYERAACTEFSTSVRLQPDISVTMQLRRKWAQRNHIRVKCRAKEPSLRVTCESMCSTTCSVALLNTKVCHMIALFPRPLSFSNGTLLFHDIRSENCERT